MINNNNNNKQMMDNIRFVIKTIDTIEDGIEIIEAIINENIKLRNTDVLINILGDITNVFQIDGNPIVDLIVNYKVLEGISISKEYAKSTNELIKLGRRYSGILQREIVKINSPFGLKGVTASISERSSQSNVRVSRNDGKDLEVVCQGNELLQFAISINGALNQMLEKGIYNLDQQGVQAYMVEASKNIEKLKQLMGK